MSGFVLHSNEPGIGELLKRLPVPHGNVLPEQVEGLIVVWGSAAAADEVGPDRRLALPKLPERPMRRLNAHGLAVDERTFRSGQRQLAAAAADYPYVYRVPIFHLEALTLYRLQRAALIPAGVASQRGEFVEIGLDEPTYRTSRAVREAVKALYALGLDYGLAIIGARADGQLSVLDIEPQPRLDARLGELFAGAIARCCAEYTREQQREEPAVLGADPEFLLVNEAGKVVSASRYLERDGEAGCDAVVLRGHRVITPLAELRPRPSSSPRRLAANLHSAMCLAASQIGDASLSWLAGGMPFKGLPLGGHIHFSRVWLNSRLLRALDNYLALPLMLIEADTTRLRRPRYGFLGDFRRQPHGGFEYRTLPSWIVTPQVTVGVFSLARVIADGYRSLLARPLDNLRMLEAYYAGDKATVLPFADGLWRELERLAGYAEFAADLEVLKARILRLEPWDERADFRRYWKISPYDGKRATTPGIML